MNSPRPSYQRLPARHHGLLHSASLWIAEDHLLSVQSTSIADQYRRIYFRDIQAILLRSHPANLWLETLAALAAVLLTSLGIVRWWLAIPGLICAGIYIWHRARGPQCRCHVQTATGLWPLPAVVRMRQARKTLDIVRAATEGVQGALDPALIPTTPAAEQPPPLPAAPPPLPFRAWPYRLLILTMLVAAALDLTMLSLPHAWLSRITMVTGWFPLAMAIIALLGERGGKAGWGLRSIAIFTIVLSFTEWAGSTFLSMKWAIDLAQKSKIATEADPRLVPGLPNLLRISDALCIAAAILGFVFLLRRTARSTPSPR